MATAMSKTEFHALMAELDLKGTCDGGIRKLIEKRLLKAKPNSKDRFLLRAAQKRLWKLGRKELADMMAKPILEALGREGIIRRFTSVIQIPKEVEEFNELAALGVRVPKEYLGG